jgi:oligoendopeptidase F
MIRALPLVLALAAGNVLADDPAWHLDTTRYFASPQAEATSRAALMTKLDAFATATSKPSATAAELLALLRTDDALRRDLRLHALYVHLHAEEDTGDHDAATADAALDASSDRLDASLRRSLALLGKPAAEAFVAQDAALRPFRYVVESSLRLPVVPAANEQAVAQLAQPALDSLANAYAELRRQVLRTAQPKPAADDRLATFKAKWSPWLTNEPAFAALLVPIATLQEGTAHMEGFPTAADAAYARTGLTTAEVHGAVEAVRRSDAWTRYATVVADAAAHRLNVAPEALKPWDMDAADGWQPQTIPFAEAVPLILAADRRAGPVISGEFEQLFDPKNARVDLCVRKGCDDTGFSVGTVGATTGLFYGGFDGSTNAVRAVAHEAGHAIHRQFMGAHQPLVAYNDGPKFMSESFAIFNELLLLDHMSRSAAAAPAQAYYLRRFLDDAVFQVFGSAEETGLEETLHADIAAGKARTATDLDARTLATLAAFTPRPLMADETRAYWARNKLYFIDPFYDVNYLFAGLLALEYLRQFERDPQDFERRYVALQGNGFDDTAAALLERFMQIDIDDSDALVRDATGLIATRTATLAALYAR